jgi:hypothetical protein
MTQANPIAFFLEHTSLAPRQSHKALTLWPVVRTGAAPDGPEYVTLSEAFARGHLTIDELPTPTVPQVIARNRGPAAVLVLFGEEIRGAMQNRIANASFLVPPHADVVLDVSCVERGRWSRRPGERFAGTGEITSSEMRRIMHRKVHEAREAGSGYHADQGEVWREVDARLAHSLARSRSDAYADYRETRRRDLDEMSAAFRAVDGQVGFVACIGDEVAGLEAIGRAEVFGPAFGALLRSYLIDAIDHALVRERRGAARAARFDAPEPFLAALASAPATGSPSLGLGTDVRIDDARVSACALVTEDVVHVTAFPAAG